MFIHRIDEHLVLRPPETRDAQALFDLVDANREYLRRWVAWTDRMKSAADIQKLIELARASDAEERSVNVLVEYDGAIVGWLDISREKVMNFADLGYWIIAAHQGKGLVTRGCQALIDYGFSAWKLRRVQARCAPENTPSQGVARRLGFKEEGVLRQAFKINDHYQDTQYFSMLAEEWPIRERDQGAWVVSGRL